MSGKSCSCEVFFLRRIALEDLQKEHQRALEQVVESKDKVLDAVAHAKDHARWVAIACHRCRMNHSLK